jgi:hypothetical protein
MQLGQSKADSSQRFWPGLDARVRSIVLILEDSSRGFKVKTSDATAMSHRPWRNRTRVTSLLAEYLRQHICRLIWTPPKRTALQVSTLPPVLRTSAFSHYKEMARSSWITTRRMAMSTVVSTLEKRMPLSVVENADERSLSRVPCPTSTRCGVLSGTRNGTSSERPMMCWPRQVLHAGVLHPLLQAHRVRSTPVLPVTPQAPRHRRRGT